MQGMTSTCAIVEFGMSTPEPIFSPSVCMPVQPACLAPHLLLLIEPHKHCLDGCELGLSKSSPMGSVHVSQEEQFFRLRLERHSDFQKNSKAVLGRISSVVNGQSNAVQKAKTALDPICWTINKQANTFFLLRPSWLQLSS